MSNDSNHNDQNIAALKAEARYSELIAAIDNELSELPFSIEWQESRTANAPIPVIYSNKRVFSLNSRYDPIGEARKFARAMEAASMQIMVGFGAGYAAEAIQERMNQQKDIERLIVLEFLPGFLASSMQHRNLSKIWNDKRITVFNVHSEKDVCLALENYYKPHLFPSVRIIYAPMIQQLAGECGLEIQEWITSCLTMMQGDFITQSRFGKRWLYNIFCNLHQLPVAVKNIQAFPQIGRECLIIGAGPSLDTQIELIRSLQNQGLQSFVCDAGYAFCLRYGLRIDYLLTIDGQSVTYLHLLTASRYFPGGDTVRIVDLCAHPTWARSSDKTIFAGSHHPLIDYLRLKGMHFPEIDTQGGNVGQSLFALAYHMGAEKIHTFGLDFAYIDGKPYARPAFFYDDVFRNVQRCAPLEQKLAALYLDQECSSHFSDGHQYLETIRLSEYKQRFVQFINHSGAGIVSYSEIPFEVMNSGQTGNMQFSSATLVSTSDHARQILLSYLDILGGSTFVENDPIEIWEQGNLEERYVLATLLPLMAYELAFILKCDDQITDIRKRAFSAAVKNTKETLIRFYR